VGVRRGGREAGEEQRYSGAHGGRWDVRLMDGLQERVVARGRGTVWYRSTARRAGTMAVPSVFDDGRQADCVRALRISRWCVPTLSHASRIYRTAFVSVRASLPGQIVLRHRRLPGTGKEWSMSNKQHSSVQGQRAILGVFGVVRYLQ
jgi:hypothetical protein